MRGTVRSAREAGGAVLVLVALALPVLIGVGGLVVDVGNWFAHKRHLQVQADAGALAGAGLFRLPCDSAAILAEASKYTSVGSSGAGYNPQIGGTPAARLHNATNSTTFYNQASPVDTSVATGLPCAAMMLDVKLTETDLPWFLRVAHVNNINAQARVEIRQKTSGTGSLPIGVPEVGPKRAKALFVNETTGAIVASTDLTRTGTVNGLATWSNAAAALPVTVNTADIGVRIVLSGSTSTQCGDPLVSCFGAGTNAAIVAGSPGLAHVRGFPSTPAGTTTAPKVRDAQVFGLACEDGYFTAVAASYPCTVNVGAVVDFGGTVPATARVLVRKTGANANTAVQLTAPATAAGRWTGGALSIAASSGATSFDLLWQTGCPTNRATACNTAKTSLGAVQRTYAGDEAVTASGPIKLLKVSEDGVPGANSLSSCATCTHSLVVTLGLKPNLANASSISDPVVSLKVSGGGSQNQGLDCDPNLSNIADELAQGCAPTYKVNDGAAACPAKPGTLWATAQAWNCVAISTGATVGQVTQGLNVRFLGSKNTNVCSAPNHWSSFPNLPAGDPRIVQVFLAPFASFGSSGQETVPVTGFASFYVTGWDGGGCQGKGDDPAGQGAVVGHFIKYIDTLNPGGGDDLCDLNSLGSCVAVFTR